MSRIREALDRSRGETDPGAHPAERHQAPSSWDMSVPSAASLAREQHAGRESAHPSDWGSEEAGETSRDSFHAPQTAMRLPIGRWLPIALVVLALGAVAWFVSGVASVSSGAAVGEFTARQGDLRRVVAGRGRIEPYAEYRVSANVLGRLAAIHAVEGQQVARGELLAEMVDDEFVAAVAQARGRLTEARARLAEILAGPRPEELRAARARVEETEAVLNEAVRARERADRLVAEGTLSQAQYDEIARQQHVAAARHRAATEELNLVAAGPREEFKAALRAQVQQAEADLQRATTTLAYAKVTAPVSGTVLRRFMEPGEVIVLQRPEPILTLADMSRVRVIAEIDETDIPFVEVGQDAIVTSDAYPGRQFRGNVRAVGWEVGRKRIGSDNPAEMLDTKVVEAQIALDTTEVRWSAGASVDVQIVAFERKGVLVVPAAAVEARQGEHWVQVRRGGAVTATRVAVGDQDQQFREVRSGLSPGDVVVVPR